MTGQRERPLPTAEAVRDRRESRETELKELNMRLDLSPFWRWRKRAELRSRIIYLEGRDDGALRSALGHVHKTVYCSSVEVGEKVRSVIAQTEGLQEL